jgi:hypothetical protein
VNGVRYANIGAAVAIAITVAGVLLFKDSSDAAMQAVAMIGFVVGAAIYVFLDERATRRRERDPQ